MSLEAFARSATHPGQERAECSPTGTPNGDPQVQQTTKNSDSILEASGESKDLICVLIQVALDLCDEMEEDLVQETCTGEKTGLYLGHEFIAVNELPHRNLTRFGIIFYTLVMLIMCVLTIET